MFGSQRHSLLNGEIAKPSVFEMFLAKVVDAFDFPIGTNEAETTSNPLELGWESSNSSSNNTSHNSSRSSIFEERRGSSSSASSLYEDEKELVFATDDVPMECNYAIMTS